MTLICAKSWKATSWQKRVVRCFSKTYFHRFWSEYVSGAQLSFAIASCQPDEFEDMEYGEAKSNACVACLAPDLMNPCIHRAIPKQMDIAGGQIRVRSGSIVLQNEDRANEPPESNGNAPQAVDSGVHGHGCVVAPADGERVRAILVGHRRCGHAGEAFAPSNIRGAVGGNRPELRDCARRWGERGLEIEVEVSVLGVDIRG
ncbi:hypothetical protein B0H19DRAFT_1062682 [Mycena capillaripes]|nr:hypothetical protein B0H19DRAFT_1062682 [Mycena capillaripes]